MRTHERKIAQLKSNIEEKVNEAKQLQTSIKQKDGKLQIARES